MAKALGIGVRLLAQLTRDGKIPHIRLGRVVIYPIAEVQKWLSEQAAQGVRP